MFKQIIDEIKTEMGKKRVSLKYTLTDHEVYHYTMHRKHCPLESSSSIQKTLIDFLHYL